MGTRRNFVVATLIAAALCGCDGSKDWKTAQNGLVGMSYKDLIECAGPANSETVIDQHTGRLRYRTESTQVVHWSISGGVDEPFQAACDANLTVRDGRVVSVEGRVDKHGFYQGCTDRFAHCFLN